MSMDMIRLFVEMWIHCFGLWIIFEARLIMAVIRRHEAEVYGYTP